MSVAVDSVHSSLDPPRSLISISTDSSRRGSLRHGLPEKHSEPPAPISPQTRLSRKRAASLNTDYPDEARIGEFADLALGNTEAIGRGNLSDSLREQVCLCQPDPKIPRPRNAFILYRQHYQAQVVAQNPGLANPEISKIIGEQWKQQSLEVKDDWKRLAEEEKQRHQRQYPGYRYQPRRAGKPNGIRPIFASSPDDPGRCPKCNGRYISTPSTPLTPFTPSLGVAIRSDRDLPSFTPSHTTEIKQPKISEEMHNTRIDTPRVGQPYQGFHRFQHPYAQPIQTLYERDEDMDLLTPSPGQKRRRFNEENQRGYAANSPMQYTTPAQFNRNGPPMPASGYKQQLPGPGVLVRQQGTMGPPPQQSPINQHSRYQHSSRGAFDESLRLPPLQTQIPKSAHSNSYRSSDPRMDPHEIQAKSVEAMVMTIPYINKIKVLSRISPPLQPPSPSSPAQEIRGSVLAIEGLDKDLLAEIGAFIDENLSNDCTIKTWSSSALPSELSATRAINSDMTDASSSISAKKLLASEEKDPFVDYLSIIQHWHKNSQEMTAYITKKATPPSPSSEPGSTNSASPNKNKIYPVALVHNGFSLTISDAFALRIPINDSYAPVDHWQWMATLWRGIVGPDLTIYVMRVGMEEITAFGGVEIRNDCAAIVVRVLQGQKMDEKTARRLGFEVLEFVRNVDGGGLRRS